MLIAKKSEEVPQEILKWSEPCQRGFLVFFVDELDKLRNTLVLAYQQDGRVTVGQLRGALGDVVESMDNWSLVEVSELHDILLNQVTWLYDWFDGSEKSAQDIWHIQPDIGALIQTINAVLR